jgi:predicted ABC-type sugar transport system permease subunit
MSIDREGLFWAVLFGLPVGVGVALAAGRSVNAPPTIPLALAMGAVAAVLVSGTVVLAVATNPEEPPDPGVEEEAAEGEP